MLKKAHRFCSKQLERYKHAINIEPLKQKVRLIVYPDQEQEERFTFTRFKEPPFEKVSGYVRFYKVGIKLPVINA